VRVGLIGAGLQGRRRAPAIQSSLGSELVVISADFTESAQSAALAKSFGCDSTVGWEHVVKRSDLDAVVICTPPHLHAKIAIAAMKNGKHVLCEKPLAKTIEEAKAMVNVAKENNVKIECGLNHRFHPSIQQAKQLLDGGEIGKPSFVRCRYGIAGRPGCENEWRANPKIAGGGEVMDQGTHAIDLSRWFLGEFSEVSAFTANYLPNMNLVEDNGFIMLRTKQNQIASIHVSLTQWKNLFSFEVFGTEGYVIAEGLGGSYGNERLAYGKKDLTKPFSEQVIEYRGEDRSWQEEWKEFVASIKENRQPMASGYDGLVVMQIVDSAYTAAREHRVVSLNE
jgi:predicted dehydrogenase